MRICFFKVMFYVLLNTYCKIDEFWKGKWYTLTYAILINFDSYFNFNKLPTKITQFFVILYSWGNFNTALSNNYIISKKYVWQYKNNILKIQIFGGKFNDNFKFDPHLNGFWDFMGVWFFIDLTMLVVFNSSNNTDF